jgi:plastocyanin
MYKKIFFGFIGLALLTVFFSACRVIDASTIPQNPKVYMGTAQFLQTTITIKKGQKLDLINQATAEHKILNGEWNGTAQDKTKEANAPTVSADILGNARTTIGPFTAAGTYKIYCYVHQGMNLTITVQ